MYRVSDRALSFPGPSHLILSVRVRILKEYENLHVHFEDCAGRRVINASGAFLEIAPCSGSSDDTVNIDILFLVIVLFVVVFLPFACNSVFRSTDCEIKMHEYPTCGITPFFHVFTHHC